MLMVGGDPAIERIAAALGERAVEVERSSTEDAVLVAATCAPDLIVLADRLSGARREHILAGLAKAPAAALVPIVLLESDADGERLERFRRGAVASLSRTMPPELVSDRLVRIAEELARRGPAGPYAVEASAIEAIDLAFDRRRSGMLAIRMPERRGEVLLSGEQPIMALETLAESLRHLAPEASLEVAWWEVAPGSIRLLGQDARDLEPAARGRLDGIRIAVLSGGGERAGHVARALAQAGAEALVVDVRGAGVGKARTLGPDVIVAEAGALADPSAPAVIAIRGDVRLAWAAVLVTRTDGSPVLPDARDLSGAVRTLLAPDRALEALAALDAAFHVRLEATGPVRLLRALLRTQRTFGVTVVHPSAVVEIELEAGLVAGARVTGSGGEIGIGHVALRTLLELPSGRVHVQPGSSPGLLNLMAKLDDALVVALRERPLRVTSLRPPRESAQPAPMTKSALGPLIEARLAAARALSDDRDTTTGIRTLRPAEQEEEERLPVTAPPPRRARAQEAVETAEEAAVEPAQEAVVEPVVTGRALTPPRPRLGLVVVPVVLLCAVAWTIWRFQPETPAVEPSAPHAARTPSSPPPVAADPMEDVLDEVETEAAADAKRTHAEDEAEPTEPSVVLPMVSLETEAIETMIAAANDARHRADWALAERYYLDVLTADPTSGRALAGLTRVHQAHGELTEALQYAQRLLEAHPDHPANFVLVADLLVALGDPDGARQHLREATRRFPHADTARERLAALGR